MEKTNISIIIPTYNRKDILLETLRALNKQSYNLKEVEVIVIDDCSPMNLEQEILNLSTKYKLRFFRERKNIGQGQIRNKGIKLAQGNYLFFLGDDTVPNEDFLEEHMNLHKKSDGIAVLGRVWWAPELRNEFMDFIENIQFHYQTIKNKNNVKLHFYSSNISLEKKWFENGVYSDKFKNYGLEDIEIGHRLEKRGLRVVYNPNAIAHHFHVYSFEQFCARMRNIGRSAVIFATLHPELKRKYIPFFRSFLRAGTLFFSNKIFKHFNKKIYWYSNFVHKYLQGVEDELKNAEK